MNNVALLSEGGKVYAKKRRKNENKVAYVEFDSEKRKEYLTGFHKRKLEKKKKSQELAKIKLHQLRLQTRAKIRAERKRALEENLHSMNVAIDNDDDQGSDEDVICNTISNKLEPIQTKTFQSDTSLTTVTVIEDLELDPYSSRLTPTLNKTIDKSPVDASNGNTISSNPIKQPSVPSSKLKYLKKSLNHQKKTKRTPRSKKMDTKSKTRKKGHSKRK